MTNRNAMEEQQLSFELPTEAQKNPALQIFPSSTVFNFVSASTLAVRNAAIKRVNESGIFSTVADRRINDPRK